MKNPLKFSTEVPKKARLDFCTRAWRFTKIEQKQYVGSAGVISMLLGLGLCVAVSAPVWNSSQSEYFEKTMHRAESLAYQILDAQAALKLGKSGQGRIPASEVELSRLGGDSGEIGTDRWGHPFHFRVVRTEGRQTQVYVWSFGPNGRSETLDQKIDSKRDNEPFAFAGDDIGVIVTIK